MKKESSFKDYKKHLKELKKKGIVKIKRMKQNIGKKLLHTFVRLKLKSLQKVDQVQMHEQVYVPLQMFHL